MADTSSDLDETPSIECFQNYTAPEVFIQGIAGIVNQEDVESMIIAQKEMFVSFFTLYFILSILSYKNRYQIVSSDLSGRSIV